MAYARVVYAEVASSLVLAIFSGTKATLATRTILDRGNFEAAIRTEEDGHCLYRAQAGRLHHNGL